MSCSWVGKRGCGAGLGAELVADLGCDVVVGFSMGANVALEMAASGGFSGPLVLLAPSLSLQDEAMFLRMLDRLGRVPIRGAPGTAGSREGTGA